MLNVHYNGDVVRCPNIRRIRIDNAKHQIESGVAKCEFCIESQCKQFTDWQMLKPKARLNKRCMFNKFKIIVDKDGFEWRDYKCIKAKERYINSLKKKTYKIDSTIYRKISSAAHYLLKSSKYKTLFLSLTFPKFKKLKTSQDEINECFSKFVENLRKNYGCTGYVAVKEYGKINNRVHFHILVSMPYHSFIDINSAWCSAISTISYFSKNAVTSDKKTRIIKVPVKALKYICKYFAKSKGATSESRIVFISNNIIKKPIDYSDIPSHMILDNYNFDYIKKTSEYTTLFRITDEKNFMRFAKEVIYPWFNQNSDNIQMKYYN